MKTILIALLFASPIFALAEDAAAPSAGANKEQRFEEHKKEVMANIEKRIASMNEHKTCVSAAKDRDALRACQDKMKDMRMEMREDRMERRHEKMGERMKKQEERMDQQKEKSK